MSHPTEDEIRMRAFKLWRGAGEPDGQMDTFWYLAEKELLERPDEDQPEAPGIVPG
jgi:Protein of unknown function (DUF2934)